MFDLELASVSPNGLRGVAIERVVKLLSWSEETRCENALVGVCGNLWHGTVRSSRIRNNGAWTSRGAGSSIELKRMGDGEGVVVKRSHKGDRDRVDAPLGVKH